MARDGYDSTIIFRNDFHEKHWMHLHITKSDQRMMDIFIKHKSMVNHNESKETLKGHKHFFRSRQSDLISRQSDLISHQSDLLTRQSDLISRQRDLISRQSDLISRQSDLLTRQSDLISRKATQ